MKSIGKISTQSLAITVAVFAMIVFAFHSDDAPFKSFARSLVKQKITLSNSPIKVKIDFSKPVAVGEASMAINALFFWCKPGVVERIPQSFFARLGPPYRGPPAPSSLS